MKITYHYINVAKFMALFFPHDTLCMHSPPSGLVDQALEGMAGADAWSL